MFKPHEYLFVPVVRTSPCPPFRGPICPLRPPLRTAFALLVLCNIHLTRNEKKNPLTPPATCIHQCPRSRARGFPSMDTARFMVDHHANNIGTYKNNQHFDRTVTFSTSQLFLVPIPHRPDLRPALHVYNSTG